jgi:hypothetical protein
VAILTRRSFLVGAGAGLITPWLLDRFRNYLEVHGEPLILAPKNNDLTNTRFINSEDGFLVTSNWMFRTTWRQSLPLEYPDHLARAETFARWGITEDQLDDEISRQTYMAWSSRDLLVLRACELLKSLDLGSHLNRPGSVGGIRFERPRCVSACNKGSDSNLVMGRAITYPSRRPVRVEKTLDS